MASEPMNKTETIVPFEVLEDDLLPISLKSSVPTYMNLQFRDAKIRFGHSYRNAREIIFDKDPKMQLLFMAQSLLVVANQLPRELVKEAVALAIDDIKNKTVGVPHTPITDADFLKAVRENERSRRKGSMQKSKKKN